MKDNLYENQEVFIVSFANTQHIPDKFSINKKDKDNIWHKYDNIGKYIPRDDAEGKQEVQQLMPYIILRSDDFKYFAFKLKNNKNNITPNMTIGISDHIKYEDGYSQPLFKACVRCLFDNVNIDNLTPLQFKGYVRDMNSKNNDHLGIVFLIDNISAKKLTLNTSDFEGQWMTKKELIFNYPKFENWSKHLINFMVDNNL